MKKEETKEEIENKRWREGFECGAKSVLNENDTALKIGKAIVDALYDVFEPKEENY